MSLRDRRVLLTGAAGGIGRAIHAVLRREGARVLLTGRDPAALEALRGMDTQSQRTEVCAADLTQPQDRQRLCEAACQWQGGIDVLINSAGVSELALLHVQSPESIERVFATNVLAPIDLCRQLLPHLKTQPHGQILNIGSVLGGIGHPGYSVYCASKFALRGFSEALRRELADSNVSVHYLAPRATKTTLNSAAAQAMTRALGAMTDAPEVVAAAAIEMLLRRDCERVLGWPEKLFVRINALFPRLVDGALRKQLPTIRGHADPSSIQFGGMIAGSGRRNP